MSRTFHMHQRGYARAFIQPNGLRECFILLLRGWRPHWMGPCWQKPNNKQRALDKRNASTVNGESNER